MAGTDQKDKLGLSATQVAAGAMAAVSASVASSFLGVAGTVIGAGVMSVIATVGSAVYSQSLRRGQERIARTLQRPPVMGPDEGTAPTRELAVPGAADADPAEGQAPGRLSRRAWLSIRGAALAVFLVAMVVVTSFEAIAGRPLSSLFGGGDSGGTSVTRLVGESSRDKEPAPPAPTPTDDASPESSEEATPAEETPTPEASPTPTPSSSSEPTPTPTPVVTPSTVPTPSAPVVEPPGATPLG